MSWKLKRTRQCDKCPWRVDTDPRDIPNGYSEDRHRQLTSTIAQPGSLHLSANAMSCHEHPEGDEAHCVGWLVNQIGPGNNLPLRMRMFSCENSDRIRLQGDQHQRLQDTFPKENAE